jgi:hypothetical protein
LQISPKSTPLMPTLHFQSQFRSSRSSFSSCFPQMELSAQPALCKLCYSSAVLTTQSVNRKADIGLCLYLWLWAKSCGILPDSDANPTGETFKPEQHATQVMSLTCVRSARPLRHARR